MRKLSVILLALALVGVFAASAMAFGGETPGDLQDRFNPPQNVYVPPVIIESPPPMVENKITKFEKFGLTVLAMWVFYDMSKNRGGGNDAPAVDVPVPDVTHKPYKPRCK